MFVSVDKRTFYGPCLEESHENRSHESSNRASPRTAVPVCLRDVRPRLHSARGRKDGRHPGETRGERIRDCSLQRDLLDGRRNRPQGGSPGGPGSGGRRRRASSRCGEGLRGRVGHPPGWGGAIRCRHCKGPLAAGVAGRACRTGKHARPVGGREGPAHLESRLRPHFDERLLLLRSRRRWPP